MKSWFLWVIYYYDGSSNYPRELPIVFRIYTFVVTEEQGPEWRQSVFERVGPERYM